MGWIKHVQGVLGGLSRRETASLNGSEYKTEARLVLIVSCYLLTLPPPVYTLSAAWVRSCSGEQMSPIWPCCLTRFNIPRHGQQPGQKFKLLCGLVMTLEKG